MATATPIKLKGKLEIDMSFESSDLSIESEEKKNIKQE